jgi:hypothetical protein
MTTPIRLFHYSVPLQPRQNVTATAQKSRVALHVKSGLSHWWLPPTMHFLLSRFHISFYHLHSPFPLFGP